MSKIDFGGLKIDPVEFGSQGNAILGIRDSGKSYTATYLAERLFEGDIPFIAFDPIGIWRFLRVPGRQRGGQGYPVVVAGGKEGDLPLTESGAPEIVRAAMRNGVSLVIDLFDIKLSKAAWRRIVTQCVRVLLHENQQHGLRHVFLEEAAEFIPQKPQDWDVYNELEKLARMGGNSRLGYTLINQRSQEVSKAILELCENIFLHRQRGKNALENLDKWLSVAGAEEKKAIMASLPDLPQGQCWAWIGGDKPRPPTLVKVPQKNSLHPDRRVMRGDTAAKPRNAVDVGQFVAGMKSTLVAVEEEDKANNPVLLRKRIAELEAAAKKAPTIDPKAVEEAEKRGFERGKAAVIKEAQRVGQGVVVSALTDMQKLIKAMVVEISRASLPIEQAIDAGVKTAKIAFPDVSKDVAFQPPARVPAPRAAPAPAKPRPAGNGVNHDAEKVSGPQQRILNSLATWAQIGEPSPMNAQVAWLAGYSPSSTSYTNPRSALKTAELLEYPMPDRVALTNGGVAKAEPIALSGSLLDFVISNLPGPEARILKAIAAHHPNAIPNEAAAADANYSASSTSYTNPRSALRSKSLIDYPQKDQVRAADWLFAA